MAAQKVRYRVHGVGMVFNFPVASGRFQILTLVDRSLGARSARFFQGIWPFGRGKLESSSGEGGLEVAAQGSGWFLSAPTPNRSP